MERIDPKQVIALHRATGHPVLDCRAALWEAGGDMDAAVTVLERWSRERAHVYYGPSPGFWEQFDRLPGPA